MGGCVAQAFAARYPLRLNGLGLIDTTAWYGAEAPQKWRDRIAAIRARGLEGMLEFQSQRWFSDEFRQRHPETVARVNDILLRNDLECYAATCIMLGDTDLRGFQSLIRVPSLLSSAKKITPRQWRCRSRCTPRCRDRRCRFFQECGTSRPLKLRSKSVCNFSRCSTGSDRTDPDRRRAPCLFSPPSRCRSGYTSTL